MARRGRRRHIAPPVGKPPAAPAPAPNLPVPIAGSGGTDTPPAEPTPTARDILINNERVKLLATLLNAIAGAFIIGGGASAYAAYSASSDAGTIGRAAVWILVGALVHWVIARRLLRNLL